MWKDFEDCIVLMAHIATVEALADSLDEARPFSGSRAGYSYTTVRLEDTAILTIFA